MAWDWDKIGTGVKAGLGVFGMLGSNTNQKRQYGQSKRLMGLQNQYQRGLNQQGHDLQMDMWNKTNYGAQMRHMKEAGLNPGLMYGMGGGGGTTTGSQGGGSQSMGGVEQQKNMGIEGAMAIAQMELLKAQTNKTNAERDSLLGDTKESNARIGNITADTNVKLQNINESVERIALIRKNTELKNEEISKVRQEIKTLVSTELLNKAKEDLTDAQANSVAEMVEVAWAQTGINQQNADANMSNAEQIIDANGLRDLERQLKEKINGMDIESQQKIAMVYSITSIITAVLGGLSGSLPRTNNSTNTNYNR